MTKPVDLTSRRVFALDGLRGIAVLLVVGYHASGLVPSGYVGVDVFFVLSGYLITTLLLHEWRSSDHVDIPLFYWRRFMRLYPALVSVCVAALAIALVSGRHLSDVAWGVLTSMLYVANVWEYTPGHNTYLLQHTWTLALEQQFYILWPLVLVASLKNRRLVPLVLAIWLGVELIDVFLDSGVLHTYVRAAGLPLGCALAMTSPGGRTRMWLARLALPSFIAVLVFAWSAHDLDWLLSGRPVGMVSLLTVPLVASLVGGGHLAKLLSNRALVWLGERSYAVYLWHFPLMSLAINQAPSSVPLGVRELGAVTATIAISAASYTWLEKPLLRVGRRLPLHERNVSA